MRKLINSELDRKTINEYKSSAKAPFIIILDNIRSMNNIGSVFRTADAFLAESIFLCGISAQPPHREIQRSALGSTESVIWSYYSTTYEAAMVARAEGYTLIAIEQAEGSVPLNDFRPVKEKKYAFIFGNEINGVEQNVMDIVDECIEIPQFGTKHSFNISVSAGIVLWHCFNRRD